MGHILNCNSITTRFDIVNGELCLIYSGNWKCNTYDVYREFVDGKQECRCLYCSSFGYTFAIPGEIISRNYYTGYYNQRQEYQEWDSCGKYNFYSERISKEDEKLILSKYPEFKYVLKKWNGYHISSQVLECLRIWIKHPKIELLIACGAINIAFNKSFYKLTEKKQKEVLNFIKEHKGNYCLNEIQTINKYKLTPQQYQYYLDHCNCSYGVRLSFPEFDYLYRTNQLNETDIDFYRDYKRMLKESDHSIKDKYWLFPNNVHEKHQKLIEEKKAKEALLKEEKNRDYIKKVSDLFRFSSEVDGYSIFVPESLGDWVIQAESLHQCILWAHYDDKVIKQDNYCLVFIRKEGKPVATVEVIGKEKRIGQFYTDEHNRETCIPSEELKTTFRKWLENFSFQEKAA